MGSTQKIVQQKIKKRIRIGAFIIVPVILIAGGTIVFQLTSGSGNFGSFDFNLGKLWSWATSPKEVQEVPADAEFQGIISPRVIDRPQPVAVQREHTETVRVRPVLNKGVIANAQYPSKFASGKASYSPIEVKDIKPLKSLNYFKSGKYIDLLQKEFLIPQGLVTQRSRIAIGASFAPGVSYRNLRYRDINSVARVENKTVYTYGQSKEYRNENDRPIMNFYSGIDVYAHLSDRWTLQTGFYYSSHGEKLTVINKNDPDQMYPNPSEESAFLNRQSVFDSPEMVDYVPNEELPFSNYYGFVEVPLVFGYQVFRPNEMLSLSVQLGASYGYLDHADVLMYNYETNKYFWIPSSDFPLINKHFISGIGGIQISQYISHEIEVFANPQFKYVLTPTFKPDYEIKQNQWAVGLRMGMKVHL